MDNQRVRDGVLRFCAGTWLVTVEGETFRTKNIVEFCNEKRIHVTNKISLTESFRARLKY